MDLKTFLKNLSLYSKIVFKKDHSAEISLFAKRYDKNHNSIFETDELQALQNDLLKFASEDGNEDELNSEEAKNFLSSILPKKLYKKILTDSPDNIKADKYAEDLLNKLTAKGKLNKEEFILNKVEEIESKGINLPFNHRDLKTLSQLSFEQLETVVNFIYIESRNKQQLGVNELVELAKLSDSELEKAKRFFVVEGREQQFSGYELAELAKLSDSELEWISKYLLNKYCPVANMTIISKYNNKELEDFLSSHNGELGLTTIADDYIRLTCNDELYTFDKNGLIEKGNIVHNINDDNLQNGTITTIYNKNLRLKQEALQGDIKDSYNVIFSNILTYYDDNNNIIRTITLKRNSENGTLAVSETDKNGIQTPIQWEFIDPESGAKITNRHLTSPSGTKTNYLCKETDTLKDTKYQIIDSNGQNLIYVHQKFEQISDNKFISSINTNPDDESKTQIYEMEYTEDYHVIVFDKKNNTTTDIDLNQYFTNAESRDKLLSTVKHLSGPVLLKFANQPLNIKYNETDIESSWDPMKDKTLIMGNYDNTVGAEENNYAILTHELGHYLDSYNTTNPKFGENQKVKDAYKKEYELFLKKTTTLQQLYMDYFIDPTDEIKCERERTAETHSILYSNNCPHHNMRRLYLAQYFPETMAEIMKMLLEEEGVEVQ